MGFAAMAEEADAIWRPHGVAVRAVSLLDRAAARGPSHQRATRRAPRSRGQRHAQPRAIVFQGGNGFEPALRIAVSVGRGPAEGLQAPRPADRAVARGSSQRCPLACAWPRARARARPLPRGPAGASFRRPDADRVRRVHPRDSRPDRFQLDPSICHGCVRGSRSCRNGPRWLGLHTPD